ncbi:universal stress protein [Dolichospermum sp. ST_sed1]|nr:universal stress protein [Dolichospermum sp. ST_sed1]
MKRQFIDKNKNICVAINFDQNTSTLFNQAVNLANATGMGIHFVHCLTPLINGPWGYYLPNEVVMPELTTQAEEGAVQKATEKLQALVEKIPTEFDVTYKAVVADPISGVLDQANEKNASLILTATSSYPDRNILNGASTAIGLVIHSPVPVMVIKEGHVDSFTKKRLSVLLADDLQNNTENAIHGCGELISQLKNIDMMHLHVHGGLYDNIADSVSSFMAESWKALNPNNKSAKQVLVEEYEMRKAALENRGVELKARIAATHGEYNSKVSSGDISEEIQLNAQKLDADLIVFGRHEFIHKSPFMFGRVPFGAMLMQDRPILVFPK